MEEIVSSMSDIGLTILIIVGGWLVVYWLDRNVFNKNRYPRKKRNKK